MQQKYIIFGVIALLGTLYHTAFLHLNEVMKIADSFAYLQMSYFIEQFSQKGLGNGWFGFIYSLPIALIDIFLSDDFLSAKIVNLILLNVSALLIWKISGKILGKKFSFLPLILWYLSPTFLHFNIHILSENIYIPLFLGVLYITIELVEGFYSQNTHISAKKHIIALSCLIGCMYLTRAEAFIYLGSIGILACGLLIVRKILIKKFLLYGLLCLGTFFLFISPYLLHLNSLTGEWGLTNKGASNLRQAELRGQEHMDDVGFERAVAELTADKTQLIAGFAGGMEYVKPQIEGSLQAFIRENPQAFFSRILVNQKKLVTQNLPEIFLGPAPKLYHSDDTRFSHLGFLIWIYISLFFLLWSFWKVYQKEKIFFSTLVAFLLPACIFFTLFFTLNRYFLIFIPILFIIFSYGLEKIYTIKKYGFLAAIFFLGNLLSIFALSTFVYYHTESPKDEYYALKKEAGEWLKKENFSCMKGVPSNCQYISGKKNNDLKIMERFPIVTYYSGSKNRFITPYSDTIQDIYAYGIHNDIDILVVDSMDFKTYRPALEKYLSQAPKNFIKLQGFENEKGQKVILYGLKK